ncbi:MAG: hypothetical protein ACI9OD_004432, partial [Limisphaerales bacterium]
DSKVPAASRPRAEKANRTGGKGRHFKVRRACSPRHGFEVF